VRCPRCGNENPETNRFCGMCGATLLQAGQTAAATPAQSTTSPFNEKRVEVGSQPTAARPASPATPVPTAARPAAPSAPTREGAPMVTGPSFLGLNQPASSQSTSRGRAGTGNRLSIDPNAQPSSRNLNYLLEDDEPNRGGAAKYVVILVALALAAGLGYLRWRNQGFGWLNPHAEKPAAATQSSDNGNPASSPPATNNNASPASSPAAPSGNAAQSGGALSAPATPSPAPSSPTTSVPATSAPVNSAQTPNTNTNSAPNAATPTSGNPAAAETSSPSSSQSSAGQPSSPQASSPASSTQSAESKTADSAEGASAATDQTTADEDRAKPSAIKPSEAKPAKPVDVVAEAQKYLYGKGVPQSCDRGLKILKPAADHANAKAMIGMGALYSAGLCTPRDLPTAYRWFAMALRKDPSNQDVQTDLEKLWGEMTQPERQLAIKLSQ
jgi:hypothetical protein